MAINCPATHFNKLVKVYFEPEGRTYATIDPGRKIGAQDHRADLSCVGRGEGL
jgi:hypothetical protein